MNRFREIDSKTGHTFRGRNQDSKRARNPYNNKTIIVPIYSVDYVDKNATTADVPNLAKLADVSHSGFNVRSGVQPYKRTNNVLTKDAPQDVVITFATDL